MAPEYTRTHAEEDFIEMMKSSLKFEGSSKAKISSQGRVSFPSEFYWPLLEINEGYGHMKKDIVLLKPSASNIFNYISSMLLAEKGVDKGKIEEELQTNRDKKIFKIMPCPLHGKFLLTLMSYQINDISLLFSSSVTNLAIDNIHRIIIPKVDGYEGQFKKGDYIYFVSSGPTLDILTENQMENLRKLS